MVLVLLALTLFTSCERAGPEPIRYGQDVGAYCGMIITDKRYGTEIVSNKGKVYKFDSLECLAGFLLEGEVAREDIRAIWVTDFANPGTLVLAKESFFLQSPTLRSPMAAGLTAFAGKDDLEKAKVRYGGFELTFDEVVALVAKADFRDPHHTAGGSERKRYASAQGVQQ
jgi:copper chaperone NosL